MAASMDREKLFVSLIEAYRKCKPNLSGKDVQKHVVQEWDLMKAATKSNNKTLDELVKEKLSVWKAAQLKMQASLMTFWSKVRIFGLFKLDRNVDILISSLYFNM